MSAQPPLDEVLDPPRAVVVSRDPLVRDGLAGLLAAEGLDVVDEAGDADVALLDPGADPERVIVALEEVADLALPVVALLLDESHVRAALRAGARGVVTRGAGGSRLGAALYAVHRGLTVVDTPFAGAVVPDPAGVPDDVDPLTPREREVLDLLAAGLSNRKIAKRLGISEHTAKFHITQIMDKLDADSRTEAVVTAARLGVLLL